MIALPDSVRNALGEVVPALASFGLVPTRVDTFEAHDDFLVMFESDTQSIRILREEGHLIVLGDQALLEPAGLWDKFSEADELGCRLIAWLWKGK